jgi:ketosteroid isomerase-like protein
MAKRRIVVLVGALLFGAYFLAARDGSQSDAEKYIVESERQWAAAVASGDAAKVEPILADDFRGVDTDGTFYDKAKALADTREGPKEFLSNHLNEAKVRFFGSTAVAQGSESWERRTETPKHGRFVWTDTWLKRNGKWQIVAAEDLIVSEEKCSEEKVCSVALKLWLITSPIW